MSGYVKTSTDKTKTMTRDCLEVCLSRGNVFCFFYLGELTLLKHGVSLCNPLQRQVSRSCVGSPSVSCGILGIAFIQLCLLWCITKPFFTPVLLCCSIITTVAEHWHALLRGVSINISVSSTNHHGWLWRCVCVCVLVGIHVGLYANAAIRQLNARALLRAWHQGKTKRPGE